MRHAQTQRKPLFLLGNSHRLNLVATLKWANGSTYPPPCRIKHWSFGISLPPPSDLPRCPRRVPPSVVSRRFPAPAATSHIRVPSELPETPHIRPKYSDPNESGSDPDGLQVPGPDRKKDTRQCAVY